MIEFIGPLYNLLHFTNHYHRLDTLDFWPHYTNPLLSLHLAKSKSKSHCDWRSVSKSWCRASSGAHDQIFITVWQLWYFSCGAPSLTKGRVGHLYLLLALASAVFLGSKSLGTRDHILLSQILDFNFRRLLRLTGSWWRYSTPPPHGFSLSSRPGFLVRKPRVGPHGKHIHCLAMAIYYCRVFLYALPSNGLFAKNLSPRWGVHRGVA
jgi:hypothetical protein